jgi:hypothetical protein
MPTDVDEPDTTRASAPTRSWVFPIVAYTAVALWLLLVVWYSSNHLPRSPELDEPTFHFLGDWLVSGWFHFDGGWYLSIARGGYFFNGLDQQSSVAFFPAFPLAMRALHVVLRDYIFSGVVLSIVFGCTATYALYRWACAKTDRATARVSVLLLILFPYAWYLFGAVYADGLFLASVLLAFILLEKDRTVLAGLAGAVATASRPLAAAVVVGLVAVLIMRRGGWRDRSAYRPSDAGVLLSLTGILAWMAYLWARFGSPMLFVEIERAPGWDQGQGPSTWFKTAFWQRLHNLPHHLADSLNGVSTPDYKPWFQATYTTNLLLEATLLLAFLALTWFVWKRLGWGYALYTLAVLATPLIGTRDFQGTGRYLLAAFPCFVAAAMLLRDRPRVRAFVVVTSGLVLTLLASSYSRGYYLS